MTISPVRFGLISIDQIHRGSAFLVPKRSPLSPETIYRVRKPKQASRISLSEHPDISRRTSGVGVQYTCQVDIYRQQAESPQYKKVGQATIPFIFTGKNNVDTHRLTGGIFDLNSISEAHQKRLINDDLSSVTVNVSPLKKWLTYPAPNRDSMTFKSRQLARLTAALAWCLHLF